MPLKLSSYTTTKNTLKWLVPVYTGGLLSSASYDNGGNIKNDNLAIAGWVVMGLGWVGGMVDGYRTANDHNDELMKQPYSVQLRRGISTPTVNLVYHLH